MKKILILLFSILLSFNSYSLFEKTVCVETDAQDRDGVIYLPNKTKPFTGKNLCEYDNGQIISEGKVKNGKLVSQIKYSYYENGQIQVETNYQYNENGQLEKGKHYKDGKLIGETRYTYYENGQKKWMGNY